MTVLRVTVKDINFLPERIVRTRKKRIKGLIYGLISLVAIAFVCGLVLVPYRIAQGYREKLAEVKSEINKLEPARPYYEEKERLLKELQGKETALREINNNQLKITEVLKQINSILPEGCFVAGLTVIAREEFNMEVVTTSPVDTARVQVGLRRMGLFEKVELAGAGDIPFSEGPRPVTFKLTFHGAAKNKDSKNDPGEQDSIQNRANEVRNIEKKASDVISEAGKG